MLLMDMRQKREFMAKVALGYLVVAAFVGVFSLVYEHFSFGVYSSFMVFACLIPLLGGALPALVLSLYYDGPCPGWLPSELYRSGIATLTIGSLFRGILDIYGTTNRLLIGYAFAGGLLLLTAVGIYLAACRQVKVEI